MTEYRSPDWQRLANRISGRVIGANEPDRILAGKQFSAGEPLSYPEALIRCASVDDVRSALAFLRENAVPFALRSGGHCFGDLSSSAHAVIDLGPMNEVSVSPGRVQIGPGALGGDALQQLAPHGLALLTGGCPHVALGGLSLVGGFGFLGRLHGLATDRVRSLQMLTADGDLLDVDSGNHAELFRALRGAGAAGFGVVTSLCVEPVPLTPAIAVHGAWTLKAAAEVFARWQAWAPFAPGHVNLEIGLSAGDEPESPCVVELYGVVLGEPDGTPASLHVLEQGLGPLAGRLRATALEPARAAEYFCGLLDRRARPAWQPSRPYPAAGYQFTHSQFFEEPIGADAFNACLEALQSDRMYGECREIEFIPWGGAYADTAADTAFIHRTANSLVRHTSMLGARATTEMRERARRWCDLSHDALEPHASGHAYQGYADPRQSDWAARYYGSEYRQLQAIKRRYDPENVFQHAQSIEPLALR